MRRRLFLLRAGAACALARFAALPGLAAAAAAAETTTLRRLRFSIRFFNRHPRTLGAQRFWCYLPADFGAAQRLLAVQASIAHVVHSDGLGHRLLEISLASFAAFAHRVVTVSVEVGIAAAPVPDALADAAAWLAGERFVEVDDAAIGALAASLARPTPMATARAIFDWVAANLSYAGYLADDLGARYALHARRGDCSEYAALVVALARASRIAARLVGGYVSDHDFVARAEDYHNWAELFLDGAWRVVDAQQGRWLPPPGDSLVFRIHRDAATNAIGLAERYRVEGEMEVGFF